MTPAASSVGIGAIRQHQFYAFLEIFVKITGIFQVGVPTRIEMMKKEYEEKLGDLAKQISAFKERKAGQAAAKKKKVSFALPCDVSSSATESRDDKKEACDFADEPRSVYDSFYKTSSRSSRAGGRHWEKTMV